jgi:hypothetical protein
MQYWSVSDSEVDHKYRGYEMATMIDFYMYIFPCFIFTCMIVIDWVYPLVVDKFIIYSRDVSKRPYQFWMVLLTMSVLAYQIRMVLPRWSSRVHLWRDWQYVVK